MWIIVFILALLFVVGGALILLRSANAHRLPGQIKAQPYKDDDF
ncbi:MAG: hypothetical protein ACNA7G_14145 [Methylobacter sp.]